MADTSGVLGVSGRSENQGNLGNYKVSRLRSGNRIIPMAHMPSHVILYKSFAKAFQLTLWAISKHSQTLSHHSALGDAASHAGVRESGEGKVLSQRITESFALFHLGEKSLQPCIPKILIFSETLL